MPTLTRPKTAQNDPSISRGG